MDIVYTLAGLKIFAKLTAGKCLSNTCLEGKTAIITGGAEGHGLETTCNLASRGCKVIVADMNFKPREVIVTKSHNPNVKFSFLNLSSLGSTRAFAESINTNEKRLDILIHNAAIGRTNRTISADGLTNVMQVNYFGPFLLTHLLLDLLMKTPGSRVVFVTSLFAYASRLTSATLINEPLNVKNQLLQNYLEYGISKLCLTAAAYEFASKMGSPGVTFNVAHPGLLDTSKIAGRPEGVKQGIMKKFIQLFMYVYGKTPTEASQTILHCALARELDGVNGKLFVDCRPFMFPHLATVKEFREKMWEETEKLVQLKPEEQLPKKKEGTIRR